MHTVQITTSTTPMTGYWYAPAKTPVPAVLLIHGWTVDAESNYGQLPKELCAAGSACLAIDLPGHGASEGDRTTYSYQQYLGAVVAAYDFLAAQSGVDGARISALGTSLGGYLAMRLCAERPLAGLGLWVPAHIPDEVYDSGSRIHEAVIAAGHVEWRQQELEPGATAALRAIRDFANPLLLIEAERDTFVPHQTIMNIRKAAAAHTDNVDYVLFGDTPHIISQAPNKKRMVHELTRDWLVDKLN